MERKIFNDLGFLSPEGKTFVDDGFTKELNRVFATAQTPNDVLIISGILKSIVDNSANLSRQSAGNVFCVPVSAKNPVRLVRPETEHKVLDFPIPPSNK